MLSWSQLVPSTSAITMSSILIPLNCLHVIFYPLFLNSYAFQWTHHCKLQSFVSSSEKLVSLMTIRSVNFRSPGASTNSFAALSTWGPLSGGIYRANCYGVLAKIIGWWFLNADDTQKMGMIREKIKNMWSTLTLLFLPPLKKRPHVWHIKMTRIRLERDQSFVAHVVTGVF